MNFTMPLSDVQVVIQWWSALFLVGVAAFPLTKRLFFSWFDKGYFFSKAVGFAVVSYIIFLLGTLHIAPFTVFSIYIALIVVFLSGIILHLLNKEVGIRNKEKHTIIHSSSFIIHINKSWKKVFFILLEEAVFFGILLFWSWVKAHEPSIRGLEKFMDYGFMQSILNSAYFPAPDMWWAGGNINYYYFGHLVTAVLTRLSGLDLSVTFNLMLATICALTATMSFSIGVQLFRIGQTRLRQGYGGQVGQIAAGLLTAFLVTFAGNMQTIYAFTKGYTGDNVVAFWTILWSPGEFIARIGEGINIYWYANATRFIPFTIHEFPSYSFVVSDVHGHVLSIPFVLLAIALLIVLCNQIRARDPLAKTVGRTNTTFLQGSLAQYGSIIFYGFLLGILLMTNALDGPIYFGLFATILGMLNAKFQMLNWKSLLVSFGIVCLVMVITALPFLVHFSSFATGIGVNCPPEFLANSKIGPFIFEGVEKCQKSPLWMMELLWGFFWFTGIFLFIKKVWSKEENESWVQNLLKVFFLYSIFLIIVPEFLYAKDIYPAHFRSNTMFKLGYEAFILWSIVAGYVITHFVFQRNSPRMLNAQCSTLNKKFNVQFSNKTIRILFFLFLIPQLFLVSIFPIFSVRSYFGELRTYRSIYGLEWLETEYPDDWEAMKWLKEKTRDNEHATCKKEYLPGSPSFAQCLMSPVIVEADGESYTDYNHVSAFTGIPTIVGWGVHEWLWRGMYDIVAPRREEVKTIYESRDIEETRGILEKYNVRYIVVGKLEREKYKSLYEEKFWSYGPPAFRSGNTVVWEVKPTVDGY